MAIQVSKFPIALSHWTRLWRLHFACFLAISLIAGAVPARSRAQAGGGGGGGGAQGGGGGQAGGGQAGGGQAGGGQAGGGAGQAAGEGAGAAGQTGGQAGGQAGAAQGQGQNAAAPGTQGPAQANGAKTTTNPAVPNAKANNNQTQPMVNPNVLDGCPTTGLVYENAPAGAPQIINGIPYCDIPSLRDLNLKVPNGFGQAPRRFGSEAFFIGTGNVNELPMDLPVGPDYVLGPGDSIVVNVWGGQSARIDVVVDRQGQITLPEAGAISITGLTIASAQRAIQAALNSQFQNEHVEISLGRVRTVRVYVVGDVQRPGAYDLSALSTPLNALFMAGGPTALGSLRVLRQFRGSTMVKEIDLYDFLLKGIRSDPGRLEAGDTIMIPPAGAQVTVQGSVHRPAIYELHGEKTLAQVLDLAGGPLITANLQQIQLERVVAHERRTMLDLPLPADHDQLAKAMSSFEVQGGDDVLISPIMPYNKAEVYLEGHVYRPGRYPYREGMTIANLVHSYQDVLPEPADHVELVRLEAPDNRPAIITLNLPDILAGNDPTPLQPFDVVRIYGRYEIDAPLVAIRGEVLRPGEYPMSKGMTAADLVRMAGGFTRAAYQKQADLSSYSIEDGQRVLVKDQVVQIQEAMEGDKNANITLEAGDVLGIRQLTGWQDIGAAISIAGEVEFAGTYAVEDGERLSSVLKRAGGFRKGAFPEGAVFERAEVRDLEQKNREELIQRLETETPSMKISANETPQNQEELLSAMRQQQRDAIAALREHPAVGRVVIRLSPDISRWANTPADIVVRAGDSISIPKRPDYVVISGQVYNPGGLFYEPGKDAGWYLQRAGGLTDFGDKKHVFIIRASGEVATQTSKWFNGNEMNVRIHPGDSIIVPGKVIGGSVLWRNLIATAQIMSSVALTGAAVGAF